MLQDFTTDALFGLFTVFVRCSAAFMASPLFGSQNTPVQIRILTALAMSFAMGVAIRPEIGATPTDMGALFLSFANEVAAGLVIGVMMQLVIQIMTMAGSFLDTQIGLGMSETLNPILGVPVTVIGQLKTMLGMVIFLAADGHHFVIQSVMHSYDFAPSLTTADAGMLQKGFILLLTQGMLAAIQIAAPVMAVTMIIDATLGVMAKALPSLQTIQIGMPVKLAAGIAGVSLCLPAIVAATAAALGRSSELIHQIFAR